MSTVDVAEVLWLLLAALGLNVVVGFGGQPMLGQGAFVAIGAYGTVLLAGRGDLPLGAAVLLSVVLAAALGWVVAFGSARLRGAHLALATWGLAWLVHSVLVAFPGTFGGSQGLVRPAPARLVSRFLGVEVTLTPTVHVVLAGLLCAAVLLATRSIARGPVGLDLAALRAGQAAAESLGLPAAALRRSTLAVAAALGAMSGAGTAVLLGLVAPSDVSPLLSVELLVAVLIAGTASTYGPVVGVAVLVALPHLADRVADVAGLEVERSRGVLTAALLLVVVASGARRRSGVARDRLPADAPAAPPRSDDTSLHEPGGVVLAVRDLRHAYGGVRVLDGIDLDLRAGEVHAVAGPNGSGKTTLLRLLAGALPVQAGQLRLGGDDVTALDQRGRVLRGVVRTFQATSLFPGLTVSDHLAVGSRSTERAGVAWRAALRTPSWQAAAASSGAERERLARAAGLTARRRTPAEQLSHGEQRVLQVVRAAATRPRVLLLDEPAAGMSPAELDRLAALVRDLAGNGVGVLLVEHDMRFVARVADRLTVLADGHVLSTGRPADVRRDAAVRAAYLGTAPEAPA